MSSDSSLETEKKWQIGGELIIPIAAVIFTLYYFSTIAHSPWTAQVNAFLVGEAFMRAAEPGERLAELFGEARDA